MIASTTPHLPQSHHLPIDFIFLLYEWSHSLDQSLLDLIPGAETYSGEIEKYELSSSP